jgi:O-antigen/teichoic acid export membrane protein
VRDGVATALGIGLSSSAIFLAIWWAEPHWGNVDLRDLIWLAPFLPMILMHDTGRYTYLAARKPARALVVDLAWVGTQAIVICAGLVLFGRSAGGLLVAWGLGATVGFTVFMGRERVAFWRGSPRRWAGQTRRLSGWFTATALIGQVQNLAVNVLVQNRLSGEALSGLRTAQTTMLQPVQNFQLAVQSLLIPRLSRLAAAAARDTDAGSADTDGGGAGDGPVGADVPVSSVDAAVALRKQVRTVVTAFAGLAVLVVAVMWPVASLVLSHIEKFADIAPLALPVSLQAAIYLVQVPFTAALRGMHQAPLLFAQYAVFAVTTLTGLVIGADHGDLLGAAWGLTTGAGVGMVVMVSLYWYALRRLGWSSR